MLHAHHLNCTAVATCGKGHLLKCTCCAGMLQISPSRGLALCVGTAPRTALKCTCCGGSWVLLLRPDESQGE